ncbi:hypothetical protein [Streptacidiphilus jiangxiensis]|uniref:Uncharacterized protein n=1 Tax=Streptacidiphilus jiangxiensis TaxID=235985 RepID=A0A1H7ZDX6_STRJI|nr:hypothetical protein [Streptacidiphilus jiangxiensis]SEM55728.1 hypothetical protein SAMN05414137_13412 [Streptacidiphilus jiangxiensis]
MTNRQVPRTATGTPRPGPSRRLLGARALRRPDRALVAVWRTATVALLTSSSLCAILLSGHLAARGAAGSAVGFAVDAAALAVAGLVVALNDTRAARLCVAVVTAAQLLAVLAALRTGGLTVTQDDTTRLLSSGAAAVVTLALLTWLDPRAPDPDADTRKPGGPARR